MPIHYDKRNKRWRFKFGRLIDGRSYRASRLLPQGWSKAEADAYDRQETARLYALATGVRKEEPSIEYAVKLYLEQHAPTLRNQTDITRALALCYDFYAGKTFSALPQIARDYATAMAKTLSPATVKNRLAYLRSACRWAWKAHGLGEHDPAERMVLPKVRNARQAYASRAEMLRIAKAITNRDARSCVRVAFYSGMRISELLKYEIWNVHASNILAFAIQDSKNGSPRFVPVHHKVAHLSDHWPPQITKWTVSKQFKAAARAVGLGHLRLHDMRHSAASAMINNEVDLYTVGRVLGHKSATSTQRYSHLATATLAKAINKIGESQSTTKPKAA